jgi:predicted GIY-YIG superfamily endonuclease
MSTNLQKKIEIIRAGKPVITKETKDAVYIKYKFKDPDFGIESRYVNVKKNSNIYKQIFQEKKPKYFQVIMKFKVEVEKKEKDKFIKTTKYIPYKVNDVNGNLKDIRNKAIKYLTQTFKVYNETITSIQLVYLHVNNKPHSIDGLNDVLKLEDIKMFGTNLKYYGLGLDNNISNNDCVPVALMKMYNNESNPDHKRIKRLTVQKIVDVLSSNLNPINALDGIQNKPSQYDGFTTNQVLHFCKRYRIKCYALDFKMNVFKKNITMNINFNKHLKALVYMVSNNHMYLLDDVHERESVFKRSRSSRVKADDRNTKNKKELPKRLIDPVEYDCNEHQIVYITKEGQVQDDFYDEIRNGDIYSTHVKVEQINKINRVTQYKKKNTLIRENSQVNDVLEVIDILNENSEEPYTFKNQKLHGLAMEYYERNYGHKQSMLSPLIEQMFNSKLAQNKIFDEVWEMPKSRKNLHSYDINKCYSSCLKENELGWAVYSATDNIEKYEKEDIVTGFYYVESENYFPLKGNGIYSGELVQFCLDENIITKDDIKYSFIPSDKLAGDHFTNFVDDIFDKFGKHVKKTMNAYIGLFKKNYRTDSKHYFTTEKDVATNEFLVNDDIEIKPVYIDEVPLKEIHDDELGDVEEFEQNQNIENIACYHIDASKKYKLLSTNLPIAMKVYDLSAIKLYKLSKEVGGKITRIKTDAIDFIGGNPPELSNEIGGYKINKIGTYGSVNKQYPRTENLELDLEEWNDVDVEDIDLNKGIMINGRAGTGKSTLCMKLKEKLSEQGIRYRTVAPTHKAALHINACTIHHLFGINKDSKYCKKNCDLLKTEGVKVIFIDEISMVNSQIWGILAHIKKTYGFIFVGLGDFNQLPAVLEEYVDFKNAQILSYMFDRNRCELTKIWRTDDDKLLKTLDSILLGKKINVTEYGKKKSQLSLCWSNACVDAINTRMNNAYAKVYDHFQLNNMKVYKNMPVISKETKTDYCNNEEFVVDDYDDEYIYMSNDHRGDIDVSIKDFNSDFKLAYAMTVHKSQGQTIDRPYTIYEWERMSRNMLYVAVSRATHSKYINFGDWKAELFKGFIYKYTHKKTNKVYIGSTKDIKQRKKEHKESQENDKFHKAFRKDGVRAFKFEIIDVNKYADEEKLFKREQYFINKYQSIKNGFNTLQSFDLAKRC